MAETEGSDEASESELLDKSLSVWRGSGVIGKERFEPIPLDLHTACSLGQHDYVKALIIRQEVDLDKHNLGGWTALMYACYIGYEKIVNMLLEADVSVNIRNHKGQTPLMLASSCGNESVGFFLCHVTPGSLFDLIRTLALKQHISYAEHEAELEARDERGWTALFHATYSGHQNMVRFLLEQGANMNAVEQSMGMTPFMEAASEGHEIIVQLFLQHGVNVNAKAYNGDTARSLALINGNMKIVSLIDNHVMPITSLRAEPGLDVLSSSSDGSNRARHVPLSRGPKPKAGGGPSITDGPKAIARLIDRTRNNEPALAPESVVPKGYMSFPNEGTEQTEGDSKLSYRDVTSPINPQDYTLDSSGGRESLDVEDDTNAFSKTGALTIKSSSGSSGGLAAALGIRREDSLDSDEFPHDSSCGDSHHHGNSGESSSEDGLDDANQKPASNENETLEKNGELGIVKSESNPTSKEHKKETRKSKPGSKTLTEDKVNEIEVLKNSVSEWINNVHCDPNPIPENNLESPSLGRHSIALPDDSEQMSSQKSMHQDQKVVPGDSDRTTVTQTGKEDNFREKFLSSDSKTNSSSAPETGLNVSPVSQNNSNPIQLGVDSNTAPAGYQSPLQIPSHGEPVTDQLNYLANVNANQVPALSLLETETGSQNTAIPHSYSSPSNQPIAGSLPHGNTPHSLPPIGPQHGFQQPGSIPGMAITELPTLMGRLEMVETESAEAKTPTPESAAVTSLDSMPVQPPPGYQTQYQPYQMFPPTAAPAPPGGGLSKEAMFPKQGGLPKGQTAPQPRDLASLLDQLGLSKFLPTFEEQDVDLQVFLSLTDKDLKEIGIKLFGPRKKMANAIARWHSNARPAISDLEQAYADRLEGEMQEMGEQLQLAYDQTERLKAQVKQEQQLRSVTETCLMEERAAWQQVQRIVLDTRQQCEECNEALKKLWQYINETKARVPQEKVPRPIRGAGLPYPHEAKQEDVSLAERNRKVANEKLPTESVLRKVDYYVQELQQLLVNITGNTDRLLGRETNSPEQGFT